MKYGFMKWHKNEFSIERMSEVFKVSRSGYYAYAKRTPSHQKLENKRLLLKIKASHKQSRQTYGSVRIYKDLREDGQTCSRKRVARLMKQAGIKAKMQKRFKVTTKANPGAIPAPNLLQQDFSAQTLNQRWVADFTYVSTTEPIYFEHYETREQARQSIFEHIEVFYNRQRRHSTLGYVSPMIFPRYRFKSLPIHIMQPSNLRYCFHG